MNTHEDALNVIDALNQSTVELERAKSFTNNFIGRFINLEMERNHLMERNDELEAVNVDMEALKEEVRALKGQLAKLKTERGYEV